MTKPTRQQLCKQIIRQFIRLYWSDDKVKDVYEFNRAGKMEFRDNCGCLLGVTFADRLHTHNEPCTDPGRTVLPKHYLDAYTLPLGIAAESAYMTMARPWMGWAEEDNTRDDARRRVLSAILRAEIKRRAKLHATEATENQLQTALAASPVHS